MKFNKQQITVIENLMAYLLRSNLPDGTGKDYLGLAQSYYFLFDLKKHMVEQIDLDRSLETGIAPIKDEVGIKKNKKDK